MAAIACKRSDRSAEHAFRAGKASKHFALMRGPVANAIH